MEDSGRDDWGGESEQDGESVCIERVFSLVLIVT